MVAKKIHRLFLLVAFVVITGSISISPVFAINSIDEYLNDWDLVDSGKHLDVDGDSIYMSHIWKGKNIWNGHKAGVIRKDNAKVIQDVYVSDINKKDIGVGITYPNGHLHLNKYYLNQQTDARRTNTATHELGHALGLGHSRAGNIMYEKQSSLIKLGLWDQDCYDAAYKKY